MPWELLRRYEHDHPGSMLHVDVTKFGNIPGGGHRVVGRQQGDLNKRATPDLPKSADYKPQTGIGYLHTLINDHSGLAYVEIYSDEKAATAAAVLRPAVAWCDGRGVTAVRVLSDNSSCYRSHLWRDVCAELGITHRRTRPYRPQTNGKIQRFHRTLADGWLRPPLHLRRRTPSSPPSWLHDYSHHRIHSASEDDQSAGSTTSLDITPRAVRPPRRGCGV